MSTIIEELIKAKEELAKLDREKIIKDITLSQEGYRKLIQVSSLDLGSENRSDHVLGIKCNVKNDQKEDFKINFHD